MRSFLICLFCFILSCTSENTTPQYSVLSELESSHFSGITIGDSLAVVKKLKIGQILLENENEFIFNLAKTDVRLAKNEIRAALDRGSVYEITIDFYLKTDSARDPFFKDCKAALDKIYGKSKMDLGYANWRASSKNNKVIEIELFDESLSADNNLVSINFFEDFDKSFYAE